MKWTIELLQEEADKCETRGDFQKNCSSAYVIAHHRKLMNELFKNHKNKGYEIKHKSCWTLNVLQQEANKYENRGDFSINNCAAYTFAIRNNLIDTLFENHKYKGYYKNNKKSGYWKLDTLQDIVNMCDNRNYFKKNYSSAYHAAIKNKLMNKLFENHINQGYLDKDKENDNYIIYVYEIIEFNKAYVGLTNNIKRRDKEHLFSEKDKMNLFCKENYLPLPNYKILEQNLKSTEAKKSEKYWYNYYKTNNWEMFNISITGSLGMMYKYSKTQLQKEVNKYSTRFDFEKNNKKMYGAAKNRKLLNELFENHSNNGYIEAKIWTIEILQEKINKYKTRKDFRENDFNCYRSAYKNNLLDELFKNHINQGFINKGFINKKKLT